MQPRRRPLSLTEASLREQAEEAIVDLEDWHARVIQHWADGAPGWAPPVATTILARSRLDRQAALCACLRLWLDPPAPSHADGPLILAWANVGSLVEGTLKFFVSVFASDYGSAPLVRRAAAIDPDELGFEQLRQLFRSRIWLEAELYWDTWLAEVQRRRNAIHAYRHRDVGTHDELLAAMVGYRLLALDLDARVPYFEDTGW